MRQHSNSDPKRVARRFDASTFSKPRRRYQQEKDAASRDGVTGRVQANSDTSELNIPDSNASSGSEQAAHCLREYRTQQEDRAAEIARAAREAVEAEQLGHAEMSKHARREARRAHEQREAAKAKLDREVRARRYPRNNGAFASVKMPLSPSHNTDAAYRPRNNVAMARVKAKINW